MAAAEGECGAGPRAGLSLQERSDEDLMVQVAQGDREAYAEIFKRFQQMAYNLALRLSSGNDSQAQEAFQEGMLRVWKAAGTFRGDGNARGWILRLVACACMKQAQRGRARVRGDTQAACRQRRSALPEEEAEQAELLHALRGALDRLSVSEQQLIGLYYGAGLSCEEISRELTIPTRTVSYRVTRILEKLRGGLRSLGAPALLPPGAGLLFQALCGGTRPPEGLLERQLSCLDESAAAAVEGGQAAFAARRRPMEGLLGGRWAVLAAGGMGLALCAALAVGGASGRLGGIFAGDPEAGLAAGLAAGLGTVPGGPGQGMAWHFDRRDDLRGLTLNLGPEGRWCERGGVSGGYLAFSPRDKVEIRLPRLEGPFPYLVSLRIKAGVTDQLNPSPYVHLLPVSDKAFPLPTFAHHGISMVSETMSWPCHRYYVTEDAIDTWNSDQHAELVFPQGTQQRELRLTLSGLEGVDDLELRPIRAGEAPDLTPYRRFLAGLSDADRGREQILPQFPSARPPLKTRFWPNGYHSRQGVQRMNLNREEEVDGLTFSQGRWQWVGGRGVDGSGCLALGPGSVEMVLEGFEAPPPLRISCRFRLSGSGLDVSGGPPLSLHFKHISLQARFDGAGEAVELPTDRWMTFHAVVSNCSIDQYVDGRRLGLACSWPRHRPLLMLVARAALLIDDLSVEPLSPEAAAPPPGVLEAAQRIPKDSMEGAFAVPEVRAGISGKPVTLRYHRVPLTSRP